MSLSKWDPVWVDLPHHWPARLRRLFEGESPEGWLRIEESEEKDALVVRAELPGIDPDKDLEVLLTEGSLEIRATREARVGSATDGSYRSEFHYGHYERTIPVPAGVDPEQIRALYKDGILEVRLPWPAHSERPHPMRVQVGRGE